MLGPSDAFGHTLLYILTVILILLFATVGLFLVLCPPLLGSGGDSAGSLTNGKTHCDVHHVGIIDTGSVYDGAVSHTNTRNGTCGSRD